MENQENDWYRGIAREFSYFMTTEVIGAHTGMDKKYGHAFYNVLFHMKSGILTLIRKKSEMNTLIDYMESLPEECIIEQLQKSTDLFEELTNTLNEFTLSVESWKRLIGLARKLWVYNLFCIYFGHAAERKRIGEIKERNYELVVKVRNENNVLFILEDFLKKISAKFDLTQLTSEEITDYLETKNLPSKEELDKRRGEFLIFMKNLVPIEIPNDKISATISQYLKEKDSSKLCEVKGNFAYKASAFGKARIILKREDLINVQEGEILVTIMTNPEYVPYLSKVAGIVTDYGGATCHAAIIARELSIPCIVGTELATKIFKDGDILEFDLKEAIVRIK